MKSNKSIYSLESDKDAVMRGDVRAIERCISSDNNLGVVFAIVSMVKHKVKSDFACEKLKELKYKNEFEFCADISSYAYAALDLLGVEKYSGNNKAVLQLIKSNFDFGIGDWN